MKMNFLTRLTLATALLLSPIISTLAQPAASPAPATPPVLKTSFSEVTSQLDPGGDIYVYLSTAQWLAHLSTKVDGWRQTMTNMPDAKPADLENMNHGFDVMAKLIHDSGVENLSGVGLSSLQVEPGLYRTKVMLHHYASQSDGFLWKMCGAAPHALTGLDLCPANTALAMFGDMNLPLLWSVIKDETEKSGFPQGQDFLKQIPTQFEKATQLKWDDFLNSFGGEFGLVLTLDESNMVPIPLPQGLIQVPSPGLLLAIRVQNDTLFNRIAQEMKTNPAVISVDTNGLRMYTMPIPLPLAVDLRPSAATSGGYLFIASSDSLVNDVLATKAGTKPGLKSTDEYKRLSQNIPDQGNQFVYLSPSFGHTVVAIQKQIMSSANHNNAQAAWMQSFIHSDRADCSYSVSVNRPDGFLTVGNGTQSGANLVLLPAVAGGGMLAAIAIPNFVKARVTAQQNGCINNLRQLDAAKQQWALEKSKTATDVPTEDDIKPYLMNSTMPVCPQGGTYTLNAVGEKPTCSIPTHVLP